MKLVFLPIIALLVGCGASTQKKEEGSLYREHPKVSSAQLWVNRNMDLEKFSDYRTIYIKPVSVRAHSDQAFKGLTPQNIKQFQTYFPNALENQLLPDYRAVKTPQESDLAVQVSLLGAERHPPEKTTLDYIPFRLLMNLGKETVKKIKGIETTVLTAHVQIDGYDGDSGAHLFSVREHLSSEIFSWEGKYRNTDDLKEVTDNWSRRLIGNLRQFQGELKRYRDVQ